MTEITASDLTSDSYRIGYLIGKFQSLSIMMTDEAAMDRVRVIHELIEFLERFVPNFERESFGTGALSALTGAILDVEADSGGLDPDGGP